ncbi:MAG: hypothetical protein HZA59_12595 [Hydrogenophilales bacterium]|nr:hypothetical protein [Hydrogenophilales bacterium]
MSKPHQFLIYQSEDGEMTPAATVRLFRTVQAEGEREVTREVEHYNLDMVLT